MEKVTIIDENDTMLNAINYWSWVGVMDVNVDEHFVLFFVDLFCY
jgi:hypothetical protein